MGRWTKSNPRKLITLKKYAEVLNRFPEHVETREVFVDAAFLIKMRLSVFKHVISVSPIGYKIKMTAIYVPNPTGRLDVYWINPVRKDIWHLVVTENGYVWGAYSADHRNSRCWDGMLLEQICICKLPTAHRTFDYRRSNFGYNDWVIQALKDPSYGLHIDLVKPVVLRAVKGMIVNNRSMQSWLSSNGVDLDNHRL